MKIIFILFGIFLFFGFVVVKFLIQPMLGKKTMSLKTCMTGSVIGLLLLLSSGTFYYAKPGHSYLVQYPWGTQKADLEPGYHFDWYGTVIEFKKVITVRLTDDVDKESETASAMDNSVLVRFNDSVRAKVSSSTRFRLPENPEQFLKLAVDYRSQNNLVNSSLVPVTKEVIRNSARELSAQDYVTGQGGQFESNVLDQLSNGIVILKLEDGRVPVSEDQTKTKNKKEQNKIAKTKKLETCKKDNTECELRNKVTQEENEKILANNILNNNADEPMNMLGTDRGVKTKSVIYRRVVRIVNADGSLKRKKHPIEQYGIKITQSTIEKVTPEQMFQNMLGKQRDAAAKAAVSRQEAKQAEYERQKVIANGETEKARVKMEEEKIQTQKIISAETTKNEAEIALKIAEVNKERAKVDAEALLITKKAEAEGKRIVMAADGALEQKLKTYESVAGKFAEALGKHRMVPDVEIGGNSEEGSKATQLMNLLMAKTAKDLSLNMKNR